MSTSASRRRRGKKETAPTPQKVDDQQPPPPANLEEQLRRAQAVMETNRAGTLMIHDQWRSVLSRLSYLLVLLTIHQASKPAQVCWEKLSNEESPLEAKFTILAVHMSAFLLSIVLSLLLTIFLRSPVATFSHPCFIMANACLPAILALRHWLQLHTDDNDDLWKFSDASSHAFPVVIVFHGVVTICCAFMGYQKQHLDNNLQAVIRLRQELKEKRDEQKSSVVNRSANQIIAEDEENDQEGDDDDDEGDDEVENGEGKNGRKQKKRKKKKKKNTKKRR